MNYDSVTAKKEKKTDKRIRIIESQRGMATIIRHLGPEESYRTLGAHINVAGSFELQIKYITTKTRDWDYKIKHRPINRADRYLAFTTCLIHKLRYPLAFIYAPEYELRSAYRSALQVVLNTLHVNLHYPRYIAHA